MDTRARLKLRTVLHYRQNELSAAQVCTEGEGARPGFAAYETFTMGRRTINLPAMLYGQFSGLKQARSLLQ